MLKDADDRMGTLASPTEARAPRCLTAAAREGRTALEATIWGARGSMPAAGPHFARYGGDTAAIELGLAGAGTAERPHAVVLDAGSGAVAMGRVLAGRGVREIDLIFTHLHYDHITGLPFFAPAHDPDVSLRVHYRVPGIDGATSEDVEAALRGYFRPPFFPVELGCFKARISFHPIGEGPIRIDAAPGCEIEHAPLNHPGGATGFRISHEGATLSYITDFEQDGGVMDTNVVSLARDADLALLDATYTPEDYAPCCGFGHAHWQACGELADRADARNWALFHHHHERTDAELARIEGEVRQVWPEAFAARTGQRFAL